MSTPKSIPTDANRCGEHIPTDAEVKDVVYVSKLVYYREYEKDKDGMYSLMFETFNDRVSLLGLFIHAGAHVNTVSKYGDTPLINASKLGHIGLVKLLLDKGADVNAMDNMFIFSIARRYPPILRL
eukprot:GHVR01137255.1.p2 GENE.GHVR01137255.1~~GHVR01137255.1.p2  ORF type:complete len:126 (+),score=11.56 GHVR01137255.1:43-420(+)